eukprot:GDKK01001084.1.p1 GENE.GDKK01001084.1~~GDKK01001084.1.p1  ORF type:complete len:135 (-),score=33.23 GDKK01001084.1:70-474(-)
MSALINNNSNNSNNHFNEADHHQYGGVASNPNSVANPLGGIGRLRDRAHRAAAIAALAEPVITSNATNNQVSSSNTAMPKFLSTSTVNRNFHSPAPAPRGMTRSASQVTVSVSRSATSTNRGLPTRAASPFVRK